MECIDKVSAKYSCGFSDLLVSGTIVDGRYLDYFTTTTEDRLRQLLQSLCSYGGTYQTYQ